jgi:hypothetical protein
MSPVVDMIEVSDLTRLGLSIATVEGITQALVRDIQIGGTDAPSYRLTCVHDPPVDPRSFGARYSKTSDSRSKLGV